jgi:hypothetical protein
MKAWQVLAGFGVFFILWVNIADAQNSMNKSLQQYNEVLNSTYTTIKQELQLFLSREGNQDSLNQIISEIDKMDLRIPHKENVDADFKAYVKVTTSFNNNTIDDLDNYLSRHQLADEQTTILLQNLRASNEAVLINWKKDVEISNLFLKNDLLILKIYLLKMIKKRTNLTSNNKYDFTAILVPEKYIFKPKETYKAKILIAKYIQDIDYSVLVDDTLFESKNGVVTIEKSFAGFNKDISMPVEVEYVLEGDTFSQTLNINALMGDNLSVVNSVGEIVLKRGEANLLEVRVPGVVDENVLLYADGVNITNVSPGVFKLFVSNNKMRETELFISVKTLDLGNRLIDIRKVKIK